MGLVPRPSALAEDRRRHRRQGGAQEGGCAGRLGGRRAEGGAEAGPLACRPCALAARCTAVDCAAAASPTRRPNPCWPVPPLSLHRQVSEQEKALREFACGLCKAVLTEPVSTPCGARRRLVLMTAIWLGVRWWPRGCRVPRALPAPIAAASCLRGPPRQTSPSRHGAPPSHPNPTQPYPQATTSASPAWRRSLGTLRTRWTRAPPPGAACACARCSSPAPPARSGAARWALGGRRGRRLGAARPVLLAGRRRQAHSALPATRSAHVATSQIAILAAPSSHAPPPSLPPHPAHPVQHVDSCDVLQTRPLPTPRFLAPRLRTHLPLSCSPPNRSTSATSSRPPRATSRWRR